MTPPEKTQEERIEAATEALRDWRERANVLPKTNLRELAEMVLEAADSPPKPKWPSDESLRAYCEAVGQSFRTVNNAVRNQLREAFLADPIIKAAIAYRDAGRTNVSGALYQAGLRLDHAVNEAGL